MLKLGKGAKFLSFNFKKISKITAISGKEGAALAGKTLEHFKVLDSWQTFD